MRRSRKVDSFRNGTEVSSRKKLFFQVLNQEQEMSKEEAFKQFSEWYEACLENGIEPEEIVAMMGGMALVTDEDVVSKLQEAGDIPTY